MARPNPKKVPTSGGDAIGGGMFQAFAGLENTGLPPGIETEPPINEEKSAKPTQLGRVVLRRETAHRGGKCVVVIDDFESSLDDAFLAALAKRLRNACGCGGTVKDRSIEMQGDSVARIRQCLQNEGFRVAGVS